LFLPAKIPRMIMAVTMVEVEGVIVAVAVVEAPRLAAIKRGQSVQATMATIII